MVQSAHGPAGLAVTGLPEPAELAWLVGPTRARGTVGAYAAGERIAVMLGSREVGSRWGRGRRPREFEYIIQF